MKSYWIIAGPRGLYWSNDWGWGSRRGCTRFTLDERAAITHIPLGGRWVEVRKLAQSEEASRG